jgi:type IV pilus assembly protein PilA
MKKTNKGFSLVELIIVIAIMAILAGAIAPALIKYIDKSRKSNDVSSAKTIKTAVETALGNEKAYEELVNASGSYIVLTPAVGSSISDGSASLSGTLSFNVGGSEKTCSKAEELIADALGQTIPKIKYKKGSMDEFLAVIDGNGNVYVGVADSSKSVTNFEGLDGSGKSEKAYELTPEVADFYQ